MKNKILFISYLDTSYSRSSVYFNENKNNNFVQIFMKIDLPILSSLKKLWLMRYLLQDKLCVIVVMNPCHIFVPFIRFLTSQPIILDAGWPLSDSNSNSNARLVRIFSSLKNYVVDFLAFKIATRTLMESQSQIDYSAKKFMIPKRKLIRVFTGFNENLYNVHTTKLGIGEVQNHLDILGVISSSKYVFFRGKYTKEAGLENLALLSRTKLAHVKIVVATNRIPNNLIFGDNVKVITNFLSELQISALYLGSSVCLGQLSHHSRLLRTIPHKAFEAGYFARPYVSLDSKSMRELYPRNDQAAYLKDSSAKEISSVILSVINNIPLQRALSFNVNQQYKKVANQAMLQNELSEIATYLLLISE